MRSCLSDDAGQLRRVDPADVRSIGGRRTAAVVAGAVAAVDQVSKQLALRQLDDGNWDIGAVRLSVVRNTGGPFGLGPTATVAWTVLTAATVVAIGMVVAARPSPAPLLPAWAIGAALGGGMGNLVDRVVRTDGGVVDWIVMSPYPRVFNLADVALRLGAVAVIASLLRPRAAGDLTWN